MRLARWKRSTGRSSFRTHHLSAASWSADLLAARDISRVDRLFPLLVVVSVLGPALMGGATGP
ncbi:hypothetical protein KBX06_24360 [Micromonospora sp. C31]|uniref:hypothetical protein n=1 Tax=Micromonospora sp. C31 TaxID=2824876 RepID=UPI001B3601AD|nr:hypothetical protein [Micromonospora sp. C31]MBQ1076266.1 hypothetical protein [Micromonospora sp. C31]